MTLLFPFLWKEEKKELEAKKRADEEICDRNALSIPLLPESQEDIVKARTTEFSGFFKKKFYLFYFIFYSILFIYSIYFIYIIDQLLEKAQKRKLEITASSIFNKQTSKSKRSKFHTHDSKDKFAKLSAIVAVNTKLKIDPFLKDNDWNTGNNINGTEKGENNKDLVIIKKKESNHHQSEVLDSRNITPVNDKKNKGKLITFFRYILQSIYPILFCRHHYDRYIFSQCWLWWWWWWRRNF